MPASMDMNGIWAQVSVSKNEDEVDSGSGSGSGELAYSQSRASSRGSMGSDRNSSWSDFRLGSRASLHETLSSRSRLDTIAPVGHTHSIELTILVFFGR